MANNSTRNWVEFDGMSHLFDGGFSFRIRTVRDRSRAPHLLTLYVEVLTVQGWQPVHTRTAHGCSDEGGDEGAEARMVLKSYARFLINNNASISGPENTRSKWRF